jgi:hypothetical protein
MITIVQPEKLALETIEASSITFKKRTVLTIIQGGGEGRKKWQ